MDIVIKSLAAAVATAIILLVNKMLGPKTAGVVGGLPIVFAISYILVTMQNKSLSRDFLIGGIGGAVAAIFFSLILIWLNAQFLKAHWINLIVAYVITFLIALIFIYLLTKYFS